MLNGAGSPRPPPSLPHSCARAQGWASWGARDGALRRTPIFGIKARSAGRWGPSDVKGWTRRGPPPARSGKAAYAPRELCGIIRYPRRGLRVFVTHSPRPVPVRRRRNHRRGVRVSPEPGRGTRGTPLGPRGSGKHFGVAGAWPGAGPRPPLCQFPPLRALIGPEGGQ